MLEQTKEGAAGNIQTLITGGESGIMEEKNGVQIEKGKKENKENHEEKEGKVKCDIHQSIQRIIVLQ